MNDAHDAWYANADAKMTIFVIEGFFRQIRILCKHFGLTNCFDTLSQGSRLLKHKLNKQQNNNPIIQN